MFRKCDEINKWPTEEMDCRTTRKNFEFLFYIGLFCGAVIANATVDYYRHLEFVVSGVGAAIVVALLPPLCNAVMQRRHTSYVTLVTLVKFNGHDSAMNRL